MLILDMFLINLQGGREIFEIRMRISRTLEVLKIMNNKSDKGFALQNTLIMRTQHNIAFTNFMTNSVKRVLYSPNES